MKKEMTLAFCFLALVAGESSARKVGYCSGGAKPYISGNTAGCKKTVTEKSKDYKPYKPCVPPGVYKRNDEKSNGRDRCTTAAGNLVGPALPCAPGQQLEVKRNQKDRCFVWKNVKKTKYSDMKLKDN